MKLSEKIKRLEMMKDMLENHNKIFPELRFDLNMWHCGTAACAVGSAMCYKPFQDMGLHSYPSLSRSGRLQSVPIYAGPNGAATNWRAVTSFFGLTKKQAKKLFYEDSYKEGGNTPASGVAERVGRMIQSFKKALAKEETELKAKEPEKKESLYA